MKIYILFSRNEFSAGARSQTHFGAFIAQGACLVVETEMSFSPTAEANSIPLNPLAAFEEKGKKEKRGRKGKRKKEGEREKRKKRKKERNGREGQKTSLPLK